MTRSNCFGELSDFKSCWGYRLKVVRDKQEFGADLPKNVTIFALKSLRKATNNFNMGTMIAKGGFSSLFKGILEDGTVVALKLFRREKGDNRKKDTEIISSIKMMSRIRNQNVVEFIGCCVADDFWILVYEFVEHTLDRLLFDPYAKSGELSWEMRASICLGVARGVEYLHHGISPSIVHRDIKPANILLDGKFNPKIADFDIALFIDDEDMPWYELIAGTLGYIDPEYVQTGEITKKVDVYSFGVLLFEVITGRKAVEFLRDGGGINFLDWVWELRESGKLMEVVEPMLIEFPEDEVIRYIDVALFCVQDSSKDRPSMSEVLLMLSGVMTSVKRFQRNHGTSGGRALMLRLKVPLPGQ